MYCSRRHFLISLLLLSAQAYGLKGHHLQRANLPEQLDDGQSRLFRQWFAAIMREQIRKGPSNRWYQRDCAGLVRYAVYETLREHDEKWIKANGFALKNKPAEINLSSAQKSLRNQWQRADGSKDAYASAIDLIYQNSVFSGKNQHQAKTGDLIFFDQGDNQHLMVWLNNIIIYHTGTVTSADNGLRAVTVNELLTWKDTRWRIEQKNPNFIGFFRFAFLSS